MKQITSCLPITTWVAAYNTGLLKWDMLAGITLASFVLPESMAYATLAGVPAEYGIYCCIAGGLFFALFTNARQVAVGPTSAISLMVGTTAAAISGGDPGRWAAIVSLTAFMVFALCIGAYFLRLSSLVNFIGENILLGFKTGAALAIASTQLPKIFGVEGSGENFFERIYNLSAHFSETNFIVLAFGSAALVLLIIGNKIFKGKPVALIIMILSIAITALLNLPASGLHIIGNIPSGIPYPKIPSPVFSDIDGIFGLSLGCFLVGYIETISVARTFSEKNGYEINPRQELLSMGAANFAAAFFHGYPVSGGLSQSTVNDKAGAKSPGALIFCSVTLSILLLWFTGLLKNLPDVILAVVVLDAITGLIKVKELRKLYTLSKTEFYVAIIAIAGVLTFGILKGVLIAAVISLIILIIRASSPNIAVLGRIPGTDMFSDIRRHPDNNEIGGCMILRVEASIFYFNQQYIYSRILNQINEKPGVIKLVVLDLSSSPDIDVSGAKMLLKLSQEFERRKIILKVVDALSEVREMLRTLGLELVVGHISRKVSIDDAITDFQNHFPK